MELPGSRIPWLRAAGAAGAVAALVVGGAVTTAGAIDDPAGAEPAKVQVMATDAEGGWFSCDIDVDLEAGPDGEPVSLAIASAPIEGGASGAGVDAAGVDGEVYEVTVEAGTVSAVPTDGPVPVPEGAFGIVAATETAGGAGLSAEMPTGTPDGAELSIMGELPALPEPSEVRPGTTEECAGMDVSVGTAVLPAAVPAPAEPAGAGEVVDGQSQGG